jgi:hypothetical protein
MSLSELEIACKEALKKYPNRREDIQDVYYMAEEEINDGGSVEHETELAFGTLKEIAEEEDNAD